MNTEDLRAVFTALTEKYAPARAEALWQELERLYAGKRRHYHTLTHLHQMLEWLNSHKETVEDWDCLLYALFYHDAVYNVLKSDNEEKSAALAEKRLSAIGFPAACVSRCKDLILATKKHEMNGVADANLLLDADLAILGSEWEKYAQYAAQIRKEYAIYPDLMYKPGRKKVLAAFLEREFIFKTPHFRSLLETQARQNLEREMLSF